jgi:tetratricopeptide (TPR) repeat protein
MAQMTRRALAVAALLSLAPAIAAAQQTVLDQDQTIATLNQFVVTNPNDPSGYARLSQAYAAAGLGAPALEAIKRALVLEPQQPEYLRATAVLATWMADYPAAEDSYRRLSVLAPDDEGVVLAYARVCAWAGHTDRAVREFERYLTMKPTNGDVWLELAKTESWRGNYARAMAALRTYNSRFGKTDAYSSALAGVLTGAGRPRDAERVLTPLLAGAPDSVELNITRALALAAQHQSRDAFASLDTLRRLAPSAHETEAVAHLLHTLLASTAEAPVTVYSDSDQLQVRRIAPRATVALQSGTEFSAGYERAELRARAGSGLDTVSGATSVGYEETWAGVAQRAGAFTFRGQTGYATGAGAARNTYDVGLDVRLGDAIRLGASRSFAPLVVSPRTAALGLTAATERVHADWSPSLVDHVVFDGLYQQLSDGNRRLEMTISPRWAVARTARINLDLGVSAYRLETTHDLANGYYDPRRYEYYAAAFYPYLKVRENVGLGLSFSVGAQRDNSSPAYHLGGTLAAETTFGIYKPWTVKITTSATLNRRLDTGAFRGFGAGVSLIRRF